MERENAMNSVSRWAVPEVSCSPRVARIRDHRIEDHDRSQIPARDRIYAEEMARHAGENRALQIAHGFARFLEEKKIHLNERDLLAGFAYRYAYTTTQPLDMPQDYDPRYRPHCGVDPFREAKECEAYYGLSEGDEDFKKAEKFAHAVSVWLFKHFESGHILPGYGRVLKKGFGGLIADGEAALATASEKQRPYVEAMLICARASAAYIRRYEEKAKAMAEKATDPAQRAQLQKIADSCGRIAEGTPQTFQDAVQLVWLTHELIYCETIPASQSLGRLDQTLYPYYKADVEKGAVTYEEASDLIDALWIKFSANLHAYQNVTIGGVDESGHFADNDLTYIMLQATRRLRCDQPLISLRYNDDMPDRMWAESMALLKTGTGFPAIFYDPAIIPAKEKMRIAPEDAKNYAMIGCVEPSAPEKEYAKTEVLRINMPMILQLVLHHGVEALSGKEFPLSEDRDLASVASFEEFYDWYKKELLHFGDFAMDCVNLLDPTVMHYYPTPFLSLTMEGCLEKGLDVTGGGTVYNNSGISLSGEANAADGLFAIRRLVFEEKKYTLEDVAQAMKDNFVGHLALQNDLVMAPKVGNDVDDGPDEIMADLIACFAELVDSKTTPRGGKWQLGLYTVEDHSKMGVFTGATPDGRAATLSLANGLSPEQGLDKIGPTAVVNSILKTDLSAATNGMVLDLKFTPSFLESDAHMDAVRSLIEAYCQNGGMEIQFNVVDRKTLLDAQAHPEKHEDLVVRVSGFSAYFTTLMKTTQDEIIARTEYAGM